MTDSADPSTRLNMRRLRAGGNLMPSQPVVAGTVLPTELAVRRSLETAVATAILMDELVMSFDMRVRPLPLSQWKEPELPSGPALYRAFATRCLEVDAQLVICSTVDQLSGFAFGIRSRDEADRIAGRLMVAMRRPFGLDGQLVHLDVRIGTSILSEELEQAALLRDGSKLALDATDSSTPHLGYSRHLRASQQRDNRLRDDLEMAVRNRELRLLYQPLLDVQAREIIGIEAFVRWDHPDLGPLTPPEFLGLIESTELIYELGDHVMSEAFDTVAGWTASGLLPEVTLWVNVTPTEVLRSGFKARVREIIGQSPDVTLGLDLPEGPALREKSVSDVIKALALDDVRASVDGFGGEYSVLSELSRLPFDTLKFSGELVGCLLDDPDSRSATALVADLAVRRGLSVVATGVETAEQLEVLQTMGINVVQGYLASQPMTSDDLARTLESQSWSQSSDVLS